MKDLSILITARNEQFLRRTVEDLLEHKRGDIEIIVGLDGKWSDPPLEQHPNVVVYYVPESIGQRAMLNKLCRLARSRYVMKLDAHCSVSEGFDLKMLAGFEKCGDDCVFAPTMKNLHAFNWLCECGHTHYQDKGSVCPKCSNEMKQEIIWISKLSPNSTAYCFDPTPHFDYHGAWKRKQAGDYPESMSLQGSCFMLTKDNWFKLNICDEEFGSWGSQGIEVACKFWLSGRKVLVNRTCYYSHVFRTKSQNGFGFPYPLSGSQVSHAKNAAKELFFKNKWPLQTRPLSWLVERFSPPKWTEEDLKEIKQYDNCIVNKI